jgi:two-component system CheB/CheR fusion protein
MPPTRAAADARSPILVGIGASAGGLEALRVVLRKAPADAGLAFVVVQHQDPSGGELLAGVLGTSAPLPVVSVTEPVAAEAGRVYVAPPNTLLEVRDGVLHPRPAASEKQRRASVDAFLRSLAADQGERAVGVVLSGAGTDGTLGLKAVTDAGGMTVAQDPATARYGSMPQNAVATGVVDHVLPPRRILAELLSHAQHLRGLAGADPARQSGEVEEALDRVCELLRQETDQNFKHYKHSTLVRRVQRRMQVLHLARASDYVTALEGSRAERQALFRELLIGVTSFFRDPDAFATLAREVVPRLLDGRGPGNPVRVWVPGCATGEEAYSLAMLFLEAADGGRPPAVQIFGTDINERAVHLARQGAYPQGIAEQVSRERLERFFVRQGGRYRVAKEVRELCLFSVHNLIGDPPFSRLDLISCRNLLIYLGPHLQKKLIPVFHYALRPNGYLFLGPSENLARQSDLFRTVSGRHRISQRRATVIPSPIDFPSRGRSGIPGAEPAAPPVDLGQVAQRILLDEFAPPYAICNEESQVVFLSEGVGKYLEPPTGTFHGNLVKMARTGLRVGLRAALKEAARVRRRARHDNLSVRTDAGVQRVMVTVQPMPNLGEDSDLFMVVFQDVGAPLPRDGRGGDGHADAEAVIEQLERELSSTRHDLESTVQDLEAANEELKSSNEELLSMNEELQSANEELETSKEEVQAANDALGRANTDLSNLLQSTRIATIFLGPDGAIRDFTPAVTEVCNLIRGDVGRPLAHTTHRFASLPPLPSVADVAAAGGVVTHEVRALDGRSFIRRVLPYRDAEGAADGLVVTFTDVSELKAAETALRETESLLRTIADALPVLIAYVDENLVYRFCNAAYTTWFGLAPEEIVGRTVGDLVGPEVMEKVRPWIDRVMAGETVRMDSRLPYRRGGARDVQVIYVPHLGPGGAVTGYYALVEDVSERRAGERRTEFLATLGQALQPMSDPADVVALAARMLRAQVGADRCAYLEVAPDEDHFTVVADDTGEGVPSIVGRYAMSQFGDDALRAMRERLPWVVTDSAEDPRITPYQRTRYAETRSRAIICVPLHKRGRFVAALAVHQETPRVWTEADVELVTTVVSRCWESIARVRAVRNLAASEERLRLAVQATRDAVWDWDLEGDRVVWSRALAELFGWDAEGGVTSAAWWLERIHPADRGRVEGSIHAAMAGEASHWTEEYRFARADGTWAEVLDRGSVVRAGDGAAIRMIGAMQDLSERKRAERHADRLRHVAAALSEAATPQQISDVVIRHGTGALGARTTLVAVSREGDGALELVGHAGLPPEVEAEWRVLPADAPYPLAAAAREGEPVWLESRDEIAAAFPALALLEDAGGAGEAVAALPFAVDADAVGVVALSFAEPRRFGPQDRAYLGTLASLVSQALARARLYEAEQRAHHEAEAARREAEEANRAKSGFLATMSHELRTPINAVIGYADLLAMGIPEPLGGRTRDQVERIRLAARHLLQLIEEILAYSRIEAGREELHVEEIEVADLLREVDAIVQPLAAARGLAFEVDDAGAPVRLRTDLRKLRQILLNLLGNAVKFTDAGRVRLRVYAADGAEDGGAGLDGGGGVALEVSDTGIGLRPEDLPRLFEPFWQADGSFTRKSGGTGLGLAITRSFAEMMGGRITVESREGRGSTFTLHIPGAASVPGPL